MAEIKTGDPKMVLTPDGMTLEFVDGLPVIDSGIGNIATISLGTEEGYALNAVARNSAESIGSSFIEESRKPITLNQIKVLEDAAEKAFQWAIEGGLIASVSASIEYVKSTGYWLEIIITPPTDEKHILLYSRNGENWVEQKNQVQEG
jgi:phage gp46-like protein